MNGLGTLLRLRLRRDRWQIVGWVGGLGLLLLFSAVAVGKEYATEAQRLAVLRLAVTDPSILAVRGAPQGTSAGAMLAFEILGFLALMAALMSTFLAVRNSRADEESGRAELVASTSAGRISPTVATIIEGLIANVLVAIVVTVALLLVGLPSTGSLLFGLGVGGTGVAFLGVGLLSAQLFSTSRGANGFAGALVGVAYLVRGVGDATGLRASDGFRITSGPASWASPIGWAQQMVPYAGDNPWPVLLDVALAAVLIVVTIALQSVRDTGAGLIAARNGRTGASPALRGPTSLAWRLQRSSIISWGIGALLIAFFAGSIGPTAVDSLKSNAAVSKVIASLVPGGTGALLPIFIAAMMGIVGLIVSGCVLQVVMRLRQEEALGTAEVVLATRVGRIRWFAGYLVVGVAAAVVILFLCGAFAGAMFAQAGGSELFGQTVAAAMVQLPAVIIYIALLGLVFATVPRATIPVGWVMLALGAFLGQFGGMMNLPQWVRDISPSSHTPVVPLPDADWSGAWWLLGLSVVALILAGLLLRRRDLAQG
jgi:ABC-2 type transport system permease protein